MRIHRLVIAVSALLCLGGALSQAHAANEEPAFLDMGYRYMYDLQFNEAHRAFRRWQRLHPDDPLGQASDAAAYLFSEFERLHILELEYFADDRNFRNQKPLSPDPKTKARFESHLEKAKQLADVILARDPQDANALFADVLVSALRSDYLALIEKQTRVGLGYLKQARALAEQLLAMHPSYYNAYLAIGVENYLLSLKPAPVRWLLQISGAQTDRDKGVKSLRITAEKGHYLLPYARLLLAVAALREKDFDRARVLLQELAQEFPNNRLYQMVLAQLRGI